MSSRYTGGLVYNAPGGWSGSFNGSSSFLTMTGSAATNFSGVDWTVETWVYSNGAPPADYTYLIQSQTGANNWLPYLGLGLMVNGRINCALNAANYTSTQIINFNAWNHLAMVRSGGVVKLYINGVASSVSATVDINNSNLSFWFGKVDNTPGGGGYIYYLNGYLSNIRFVKGTAVYTANFTPPTGALQPISGTSLLTCAYSTFRDGSTNNFTITATVATVNTLNPFPTSVLPNPALGNAGNGIYTMTQYTALRTANQWPAYDPFYRNVTLNLHGNAGAVLPFNSDASTNNFQVTQVGDTRPSNLTPFIANGYWSNFFGGSGNSLNYPSASQYAIGTGNFTVEFFVNFASLNAGHNRMFCIGASGTDGLELDLNGTNLEVGIQNGYPIGYTWTPTAGIWYYVAVTRSGSTVTLYINGTSVATGTSSNNISQNSLSIGGISWVGSWSINGYLSNVRLSNTVRTIAVPTAPYTSDANTLFLGAQSSRFLDNSSYAATATPTGSPAVNPFQPFTAPTGTSAYGSGYFDGSGDYLSVLDNTALEFGSGDFTVEMWAYYSSTSGTPVLIDKRANTGGYSPFIFYTTGGVVVFYSSSNGSSYDIANGVTIGTIIPNQWNHVAASRSGTSIRLFLNGVLGNTVTSSSALVNNSDAWTLGATPGGNSYNGYLSNARLVKGTAVYTSAFTPPTAPLTAITNTSLLTVQTNAPSQNNTFLDSSTNNFVITRNGNTTQGTFTPYGNNWSNYFDGSGDYLSTPSSSGFAFGTGDFTVEAWINTNILTGEKGFIQTSATAGGLQTSYGDGVISVVAAGAGSFTMTVNIGGTNITGSIPVTTGTWYHVAFTRASGSVRLFINGALAGGPTTITANLTGTYAAIGGYYNTSYLWSGYISNLRVVKGTALYTAAFTPPTAPLTAITNTSLLTCADNRFIDDSTNNFTITRNGDVSVQRFSPFSPTTAYSTSVIGGSMYSDGSGDSVTAPSNTAFAFGTGDFTVEFWAYIPSWTNEAQIIGAHTAFVGLDWLFQQWSSGEFRWLDSSLVLQSGYVPPTNQWNHYACTRSGTTLRIFVNGVQRASGTSTANIGSTKNVGMLGDTSGAQSQIGYMSNVRIVKGTAVYTSGFTPPTAPLTAITGTSLLLNYTNAGILDNAMMNDLETVGNAQISTSVKKYGSASMYFDGSGDYLVPSANLPLTFGAGDFTVEFWVYFISGLGSDIVLYDSRPISTNGVYPTIYVNSSSQLSYVVSSADRITSGVAFRTLTWYHVAVCRSGTSTRMFVNGSQVGSTYSDSNNYLNPARRPTIAINGFNETAAPLNGYLDDLRVTRAARYTANFTPPTSQVQDQ